VLLLGLLAFFAIRQDRKVEDPIYPATPDQATQPDENPLIPTDPRPTQPDSTDPVMLENMAQLYEKNPEIAGWLKIEGTKLDYPVMYTPYDPEKYIDMDFEGNETRAGIPFMEDTCSFEPESDNLIIYGHNFKDGTMFRTLMSYEDEKFWKDHPQIQFSTLYENRTYEVLAAFYDRVYYKHEDVFKFYQFVNAENEEDYKEAINYYKTHSLYDTGVTAEYGDRLLTLVTCAYHEEFGRFVVVARQLQ
jgi:sortase B